MYIGCDKLSHTFWYYYIPTSSLNFQYYKSSTVESPDYAPPLHISPPPPPCILAQSSFPAYRKSSNYGAKKNNSEPRLALRLER